MTISRESQFPQGFQGIILTDATVSPPPKDAAVLGGDSPLATAAVLGGQGVYLARLFDWFNSEAKRCNESHLRIEFTAEMGERYERIALVGKHNRQPLDSLKIKVKQTVLGYKKQPYSYWEFAGYLSHGGSLFNPPTATYDPARCEKDLRGIAYQALITKARALGGVQ